MLSDPDSFDYSPWIDTEQVQENVEDFIYPERDRGSLITQSGRFLGAYAGVEAPLVGLRGAVRGIRTVRVARESAAAAEPFAIGQNGRLVLNPKSSLFDFNSPIVAGLESAPPVITGTGVLGLSESFAAQRGLRLVEPALPRVAPNRAAGVLDDTANFAQKTFSETFSKGGRFSGRTIDDVAGALRRGDLKPSDVPLEYFTRRSGQTLISNTRSA